MSQKVLIIQHDSGNHDTFLLAHDMAQQLSYDGMCSDLTHFMAAHFAFDINQYQLLGVRMMLSAVKNNHIKGECKDSENDVIQQ